MLHFCYEKCALVWILIHDLPAENKLFSILAIFTNVARICFFLYGERDGKLCDFKWADLVVQKCTNENVPLCFVFFLYKQKNLCICESVNYYSFNEKKHDFVTFSFLAIGVIRISSVDFKHDIGIRGMWGKRKQSLWELLNLMLQWRGCVGEKVCWSARGDLIKRSELAGR